MHGPWTATGHTPFGEALRRFSVRPCNACRRGRVRRLVGLFEVGAGRLGPWRPHCSNTDRYPGALDDGRARRLGHGCPGGTVCAAAVRNAKRPKRADYAGWLKRTRNPTQFVEPEPRFNVMKVRGVPLHAYGQLKPRLGGGFPLELRKYRGLCHGCAAAVCGLAGQGGGHVPLAWRPPPGGRQAYPSRLPSDAPC
jgi:hypothetical protein